MATSQELRNISDQELERELHGARDRLRQARFDLSAGQLKNIQTVRQTRREIARMLTALVQRAKKSPQDQAAK